MMNALREQLKRLADDERAVSPVVGFVLIFALIMIVFTLYQSSVVPAQNEEIEFKHSQTVEGEMSRLNDAMQQASTSGVPQSVTIDTGVQYPDRALAINPGSPAGSLTTSDPQTVAISGLSDGSSYWDGTKRTFDTRLVRYRANYNLLQQETTYTLENGMFVKNYESDNSRLESNGSVISNEGRRINLALVGGNYQKSAITTSVTAQPVSTSTEYLHLDSDGSGRITVPTTLDRSQWQRMLDGKEHVSLQKHTSAGATNEVTILLDSTGTYEIRLGKTSLGGSKSADVTYLKNESRANSTAAVGTSEPLAASARDAFGNPKVAGTVGATVVSGSGTFARSGSDTATAPVDENGRVGFGYTPSVDDAGSTVSIELALTDEGNAVDTVTYELDVGDDTDRNDSGGIGGNIDNGFGLAPSTVVVESAEPVGKDAVEFTFANRGGVAMTANRTQFNGYLGKFSSGKFATSGRFAGTDVALNGNVVTLDTPFTVPAGGTASATLSDLDANADNGLLILSIEYSYRKDGEKRTDTATYSVSISSKSGGGNRKNKNG